MYRQSLLMARGAIPGATSPIAPGTMLTTDQVSGNSANNFYFRVAMTGPTTARPQHGDPDFANGPQIGFRYYDTTLSAMIIWDGATWRNEVTGVAS
jgi:hypothetical protein